jgi:CheY-like chemotaxis protein
MSYSNKHHFILIDDNEIDLLLHQKIIELAMPNTAITSFTSGELAINFFKGIQTPELFVLLLDIKMPVMDGFQFLDAFANLNQEMLHDSKIFLLSSSTNQFDISRAHTNALVSAMINKPLSKDQLLKLLTS